MKSLRGVSKLIKALFAVRAASQTRIKALRWKAHREAYFDGFKARLRIHASYGDAQQAAREEWQRQQGGADEDLAYLEAMSGIHVPTGLSASEALEYAEEIAYKNKFDWDDSEESWSDDAGREDPHAELDEWEYRAKLKDAAIEEAENFSGDEYEDDLERVRSLEEVAELSEAVEDLKREMTEPEREEDEQEQEESPNDDDYSIEEDLIAELRARCEAWDRIFALSTDLMQQPACDWSHETKAAGTEIHPKWWRTAWERGWRAGEVRIQARIGRQVRAAMARDAALVLEKMAAEIEERYVKVTNETVEMMRDEAESYSERFFSTRMEAQLIASISDEFGRQYMNDLRASGLRADEVEEMMFAPFEQELELGILQEPVSNRAEAIVIAATLVVRALPVPDHEELQSIASEIRNCFRTQIESSLAAKGKERSDREAVRRGKRQANYVVRRAAGKSHQEAVTAVWELQMEELVREAEQERKWLANWEQDQVLEDLRERLLDTSRTPEERQRIEQARHMARVEEENGWELAWNAR